MTKMVCTQNISSGIKEYRALLFKKGKEYDVEIGRFVHKVQAEDGRRIELQLEVIESHFMTVEDYELLKQVEYMINEIGIIMDDLESNNMTAKEFKELFMTSKGKELCTTLVKARRYMKG